jgi:hypothetical protein
MAMTEKSCPPPISFIHWLSDRNQHRAFTGTQPLIATEPFRSSLHLCDGLLTNLTPIGRGQFHFCTLQPFNEERLDAALLRYASFHRRE